MSVYFIESSGFVKIGYSTKPMNRIRALQTSNPTKLELLLVMPGNSATEKEFHSVFSDYHCLNEWYRLEGELKSFIDFNGNVFQSYMNQFLESDSYQDERDWEYWKARAEKAEVRLREALGQPVEVVPITTVNNVYTCACGWSTDKGSRSYNAHKRHCKE